MTTTMMIYPQMTFVVSLESEDRTIEALWEADGGVMNQHPLSRLLSVDIPPGNKNKMSKTHRKKLSINKRKKNVLRLTKRPK